MVLPIGYICHSSSGRLRIRVPDRKRDDQFFFSVEQVFHKSGQVASVQVRPLTASILLTGEQVAPDVIDRIGAKNKLFQLSAPEPKESISNKLIAPMDRLNRNVQQFTGGEVDMQDVLFLLLVGFGLYGLIKGDLRRPAWYTAFWYAAELFRKYISAPETE
jgi:hypothetical protein